MTHRNTLLFLVCACVFLLFGASRSLFLRAETPSPAFLHSAENAIPLTKPQHSLRSQPRALETPAISTSTAHHIDSITTNLGPSTTLILGATNSILVIATISDQAVIPQSVFLYSEPVAGGAPVLLGILHDDGLNGDFVAGDSNYTLAINGKQFTFPGQYTLFVSAAFRGALLRAQSSSLPITIMPTPVQVDTSWSTYHDPQFTVAVPTSWLSSTTSYAVGSGPTRVVEFALPTDPTNPVFVVYAYPHGFDVPDQVDEPPTYLGTNNRNDFYYALQNGDEDPAALTPLGLTDQTLHNELTYIVSTFLAQ
jgi:hypothetical protein